MKANLLIFTILTVLMVACTSTIEPIEPAVNAVEPAVSDNNSEVSGKASPVPTVIKETIKETTMTTLEDTSWRSPNLDGEASKIAPFKEQITLEFADGKISGSAGCNRYFASYTQAADGTLTLSPIGSTRRACERSLMSAEYQFLQALQATTHFSISEDGTQLTLTLGEKGKLSFALNS